MTRYYGRIKSTKKFDRQHKYMAVKLPNIIDLSMYRPKIINQLNVNRCIGCGIGGAMSGKLSQLGLNPANDFIVSPDDIYNGARALEGKLQSDAGSEGVDAYKWVQKYGYIPYSLWPLSATFSDVNPATLENEAIQLPDFQSVGLNTSVDGALAELLDAMAAGNFVTVGAAYFAQWENYKSGIQPTLQRTAPIAGEHEEYFYYADLTQRYLKRANSWGTDSFGEDNPDPDKGCEYISFDEIPILAAMGMDLHYSTFKAPDPNSPANPPTSTTTSSSCCPVTSLLRQTRMQMKSGNWTFYKMGCPKCHKRFSLNLPGQPNYPPYAEQACPKCGYKDRFQTFCIDIK